MAKLSIQGKYSHFTATIDTTDFAEVDKYRWTGKKVRSTTYAQGWVKSPDGAWVHVLLHRFILGQYDPSVKVLHRNRDGMDNRKSNLREYKDSGAVPPALSLYKDIAEHRGVCKHKATGKWQARIQLNGVRKHLGYFTTEAEAVAARAKVISN